MIVVCAAAAEPVAVGSKAFTESVILGELAAGLVRGTGLEVEHRQQLGGTRVLWEALVSGAIDVYPEYTGTVREEILGGAQGDLAEALRVHGVRASASLGFSDTYALGMVEAAAEQRGVRTLGDLARHPELRYGLSNEFLERADGWPKVRAAYGLEPRDVRGLVHDLAYPALAAGTIDVVDLYSTDAEIRFYGLRVLVDERRVFPEYEALWLYRDDLPEEAVAALLRAEGQISAAEMIAMNAAVKLDRRSEVEVAGPLAAALGGEVGDEEGLWGLLWRTTVEHVRLVVISLVASVALAVPLGILAARAPRVAPALLGAIGILQTIPSIALLVAFIPLLGIGERPALVALVLYGLLPVARSTHAGLTSIPRPLQESAEALGLPSWRKLWWIELPLAAPHVLSGIKTAAVISVGTATLGALVGAGGYGQPILSGIRLARTDLILLGAVPAAVLALLVQAAFDLLERRVGPRP